MTIEKETARFGNRQIENHINFDYLAFLFANSSLSEAVLAFSGIHNLF